MSDARALLDEHEDEVFEMIAGGADIQDVAARFEIHRNSVRNWVKAGGDVRQAKLDAALEENAEWHVEQSGVILSQAWKEKDISPARSVIAREMSKRHQWIAEKRNRRLYGEQPASVNVNLNTVLGLEHLQAVKQLGNRKAEEIPVAEFKELTDGS